MMTSYLTIKPPFLTPFKDMSKDQSKIYLKWFQEQIPIRIQMLSNYVRSFSEYRVWEPSLNSLALDMLGEWFSDNVKTRTRTPLDILKIHDTSPKLFDIVGIPDYELTDQTFSLSIDIGMYLSQILKKAIPVLEWKMGSKPKNNADYQQPVLAGRGKLVFNPTRLAIGLAYGLVDKSKKPQDLKNLYEIWLYMLSDQEQYH